MKYNSEKHHRRSIRLKGYDYSQSGLYFITICVQNRHCLFGEIENDEMILNEYGKIAATEWINTESIRDNIRLHEYIIMPNHIHGIIEIVRRTDDCKGESKFAPNKNDCKGDDCKCDIQLVKENFINFRLGFTLNDRWFQRYKYD